VILLFSRTRKGYNSCYVSSHLINSMGRSDKSSGLGSQRHDPLGVQLRTDTSGLLSAPGRRANKKHKKIAKEEDVSCQSVIHPSALYTEPLCHPVSLRCQNLATYPGSGERAARRGRRRWQWQHWCRESGIVGRRTFATPSCNARRR
jgi:hypothetical protein